MKIIVISGIIGIPAEWQNDPDMADHIANRKEEMRKELKAITETKQKEIYVEIESPGGDVNHAIAMRNALANSPAKVIVEYTGWSASAATIIATGGDVVKSAENVMILPHEARGVAFGVKDDIEAYAVWLEKTNNIIAEMYAKKSGKSKEEMLEVMAKNNGEGEWLTATEAMELGLIDEVYEPMAVAASFSPEYIGLPSIPKEKLSILNQINMGIFSKKEEKKPVFNSIELGDGVTAVYENELIEGSELQALNGAELADDTYQYGDKKLVIENSVVKEIQEPKAEEVVSEKNEQIEVLESLNTELSAKVEAQAEQMNTLQASFDELKETLKGVKSTHQTDEKNKVNEIENELPLNLQIKKEIQAEVAKLKNQEE